MIRFFRRRRAAAQRSERGFFTIWVLGLCVFLFMIGGLSLDLWRAFSQQRALTAMTDGASVAGASQLDLTAFKEQTSTVKLDPSAAKAKAAEYLQNESTQNHITLKDVNITVTDTRVLVSASTDLKITFASLVASNSDLTVHATSAADPTASD
jgi:Flp pilus assembly protein TadG